MLAMRRNAVAGCIRNYLSLSVPDLSFRSRKALASLGPGHGGGCALVSTRASARAPMLHGASFRSALHMRQKAVLNAIRCAIACAVLSGAFAAQAQNSSFPARPIRFVVAFVPGGATDTLTRQLTEDFREVLGQPIVVENRPGANGYLAWNETHVT